MTTHVSVEALRGIEIVTDDDIYDLARLILRLQAATDQLRSKGCVVTTRMSLRSVARALAELARVSVDAVVAILDAHGIPLEAMLVTHEEAHSREAAG